MLRHCLHMCHTARVVVLDVVTDAHEDTLLSNLTEYTSRGDCPKQISTENRPVFASGKAQLLAVHNNVKWIFNAEKELRWFVVRWFLREVTWISKKMDKGNNWSYFLNLYRNTNIVF